MNNHGGHESPIVSFSSFSLGPGGNVESFLAPLFLSSSRSEVKLWNPSTLGEGPLHTFSECRGGKFSNKGGTVAAVHWEGGTREVRLFDSASCTLTRSLVEAMGVPDSLALGVGPTGGVQGGGRAGGAFGGAGVSIPLGNQGFPRAGFGLGGGPGGIPLGVVANHHPRSAGIPVVHFSPLDDLLLWNGFLWDVRSPRPVHRFDQFTDFGGGGFHPSGNEVGARNPRAPVLRFQIQGLPSPFLACILSSRFIDVLVLGVQGLRCSFSCGCAVMTDASTMVCLWRCGCIVQVILNSEVWDLRTRKLLRSVPSLDQTTISFNSTGEVIYANLRRSSDEIMAALHGRRRKHPLFSAFKTIDAATYTDIAMVHVDRCVLDLATEPSNSLIGIVAMDENGDSESVVRLYEVGKRRAVDDESDEEEMDESDEDGSEQDGNDDEEDEMEEVALLAELGESSESDDDEDDEDDDEDDEDEDDDGEEDDDDEEISSGDVSGSSSEAYDSQGDEDVEEVAEGMIEELEGILESEPNTAEVRDARHLLGWIRRRRVVRSSDESDDDDIDEMMDEHGD